MVWRKIGWFGLFTATLVAGCSRNSEVASSTDLSAVSHSTTVSSPALPRDDLGREIKLTGTPRRIISLAPGVTETIFALGEGERVVGRDQMSDYPAAAAKLPQMADFTGPFFEKAVAARPDFLLAQGETLDRARIEMWEKRCGAPVALLNPQSIEGVKQGTRKIAVWLGVPEKAADINQTFPVAQPASKLKVFLEIGRVPLWSAGRDTLVGDQLATLGYQNVADIKGYKQINAESLIKAEPDVYIVTAAQPNQTRTLAELRKIPSLRGLRCIKQGRVVVVPADWVLRPGPRLPQGMKEMARQVNQFKISR